MILTSARRKRAEVRERIVLGLYTVQYNGTSKKGHTRQIPRREQGHDSYIRKIRKSLRGLNDLNLWLSSLSQLSMLILCLVNFRLSNGNQASSSSSYLSVDKLQKDESTSKCMF